MRFFSFLTIALSTFALNSRAVAQEMPETEIDFVRKLRAKSYSDLALEYIDILKKRADPALTQLLILEQGRTLAAQAREKEPEQRAAFFAAARTLLEEFVQKNAGGPDNAIGRLEIARLASYQGEALLGKALREEETATQQDYARKAEQQFMRASQELEVAVKLLPEAERLPARFDRAISLMNQSRTIFGQDNIEANSRRGALIVEAKKQFDSIAAESAESEIGMLAAAWLVKCSQEIQAPTDAKKFYDRVMNYEGKSAQAAQRAARLFYVQGVLDNPTLNTGPQKLDLKGKLKLIEDECKKWLAAYPAYQKTPEGWAIRYELGMSLFKQGQLLVGKEKTPPKAAMTVFEQAQKHFSTIAESGSDYSEKANQKNIQISYWRLGDKTAISDLKDFEECYLKAQVEMFKMREVSSDLEKTGEKERPELEKKRKEHHALSLQALARALVLADAKTPASKIDDVRFYLGAGYWARGDLYRAAVACEALGRGQPPSKRASMGAGYAIEAYAALIQRDPADDGARLRFKELAEFVLSSEGQKNWANDPVTAISRRQLALLYNRDSEYSKAIEQLELLPRDYAGYIYAQGELVQIAVKARQDARTSDEKKIFQNKAQQALQRMGNLPADADPSTTDIYFRSLLQQSLFLLSDAILEINNNDLAKASQKYQEMAKFLDDVKSRYDKLPKERLNQEKRDNLELGLDGMKKYARLGLIEIDYRHGQYDKVLAATAGEEAAVNKLKVDATSPIKLKDYKIVGDILVLNLRAKVQKGKITEARDLLHTIERLTGEDGNELGKSDLPQILVADMKTQVDALKKAGDTERLRTVVANFSAFVDELAKKLDPQALKPADLGFFALSYNSLEEYGKAADLFMRIPPPKALNKDKLSEEEDHEVAVYWSMRLQYAKALRMSARVKDPAKANEDQVKAKKVLDEIVNHKNGRQQILADMENLHLLEDRGLYNTTIKGWGDIMSNVSKQLAKAPSKEPGKGDKEAKRHQLAKELYFDAYYQKAWCFYKYSQTKKVLASPELEKKYITVAANHIYQLEEKARSPEGWQLVGYKFQALMRDEPKLRAAYDELKKSGT